MLALQHVNTRQTRTYMGAITGGESLHTAFARLADALDISAAAFDMLGGLTEVELSEYDFINRTRKPPLIFARPLEIISGHGAISRLDGRPHIHIHLTLSFRDEGAPHGIAVIGGHAARARAFAVEFTLHVFDGAPVTRAMDEATGLQLWNLPVCE